MMLLTTPLLAQLYAPTAASICETYVDHLNAGMAEFSINTQDRAAAFLGQLGIESRFLTRTEENLHYTTPSRLNEMFGLVHTDTEAAALIRGGPQAIANHVYAGRMGNGDEASGDGWRHRGLGLIQLTGKDNQSAFGDAKGMPIEQVPAYLVTPKGAAESACWFFVEYRDCNALADVWDINGITLKVNGKAMAAAADRLALSVKARKLLA